MRVSVHPGEEEKKKKKIRIRLLRWIRERPWGGGKGEGIRKENGECSERGGKKNKKKLANFLPYCRAKVGKRYRRQAKRFPEEEKRKGDLFFIFFIREKGNKCMNPPQAPERRRVTCFNVPYDDS